MKKVPHLNDNKVSPAFVKQVKIKIKKKVFKNKKKTFSKKKIRQIKMWKSSVGANNSVVIPSLANGDDDDDWETDPDYVNEMSEEQQRWGGARDTGVLE